jgi:transposase
MGPLSLDLRVRIVEAYESGEGSVREIAERYNVTPKTVQAYRKLWTMTGSVLPRPHGGGNRKLDDALLRQLVEEKRRKKRNDWKLDELVDEYAQRHGRRVASSTMSAALRRIEWTRKKKTLHASEQNRPRVRRARAQFAEDVEPVAPPKTWWTSMSSGSTAGWCGGTAGPRSVIAPTGLRRRTQTRTSLSSSGSA